jgi:hypothetical protein
MLNSPHVVASDSQTQDDTQLPAFPSVQGLAHDSLEHDLKRKTTVTEEHGNAKKMKISLATLVDLGS